MVRSSNSHHKINPIVRAAAMQIFKNVIFQMSSNICPPLPPYPDEDPDDSDGIYRPEDDDEQV